MNQEYTFIIGNVESKKYSSYEEAEANAVLTGKSFIIKPVETKIYVSGKKIATEIDKTKKIIGYYERVEK
jgi:hypothetical protein